jgi:FkbM family methyltransferase
MMLCDDFSRQLFLRILLYRMLGHHHIVIQPGYQERIDMAAERIEQFEVDQSELTHTLRGNNLTRYENVPYLNGTFSLDFIRGGIAGQFFSGQYDYDVDNIRVMAEEGDYVIDGGCCMGDTCVKFSYMVGEEGRVYSFDPLPQHIEIAEHNVGLNELSQKIVEIHPYGLDKVTNKVKPLKKTAEGIMPGFSSARNNMQIPCISIDRFVQQENVERIDFIKMDIEGCELAALKGAQQTIRRYHPKLAICLYHKVDDFTTIPQYLKDAFPFYSFYLGHYSIHAEETVLYAIDHNRQSNVGTNLRRSKEEA